ncbi:MAG: MlaA family lipoprotein [Candidatus Methylomirabilaceae bacterium]
MTSKAGATTTESMSVPADGGAERTPAGRRSPLPWTIAVTIAGVMAGSFIGPDVAAEQSDSWMDVPQAGTLSVLGERRSTLSPRAAEPSGESTPQATRLAGSTGETPSDVPVDMTLRTETEGIQEYDPWEPYNETMFSFNHDVFDRYLLKPVATAWDTVVPDPFQRSLKNLFVNLGFPRRFVNSVLQLKFEGAGHELVGFVLNTTIGVGGLFDIATEAGLKKSDEDTGQTLGVYGVGPGPYLILPILPPLTVRDGFGLVADIAMDPLTYVLPFAGFAVRYPVNVVNERSLNLELFESVEESTVDLYSAVRNGYLQRRQNAIQK